MTKNDVLHNKPKKEEKKKGEKKKKKKKRVVEGEINNNGNESNTEEKGKGAEEENEEEDEDNEVDMDLIIANKYPDFKRGVKILEELKKKYPQFSLNGDKNIWIMKPAGSSRGRGIVLYKQLVEILDLCKSKESQFIA